MSWVFEGVDKFTGPMGAMSTSIVKLAFGLNETKDLLMSFGHALEWVAEKGFSFGEMAIDAIAFKEASLNSFEVMLGTRKQAHAMFDEAQAFADLTPFSTKDVISSFQGLSATFKEKEVPIVFQAVADVASFAGTRQEGQEIIRAMTSDIQRMYAYGKASPRDLIPILNAGRVAGLSPQKYFQGIADVLGITVPQATAKYHAGMIDANTGTVALIRTIKNITHMEVGGAVMKQATTINGLLSTAASLGEDFFFSMSNEAEDISGVVAFKGALTNIIGYFGALTPTGKRVAHDIETVFSGAFKAIFGAWSGPGGAEKIKNVMEKILGWVESVDWERTFGGIVTVLTTTGRVLWAVFSGFWKVLGPVLGGIAKLFGMANSSDDLSASLEQMGKVLGVVVGGLLVAATALALLTSPIALAIVAVIAWWTAINALFDVDWAYIPTQLADLANTVGEFFAGMAVAAVKWGLDIIYGIGDGIANGVGWLVDKVSSAGSAIMTAFKDKLGIASPSTVFEEYGRFTTEGYVQGVEGGMDDVSGAFDGLLKNGASAGGGGSGNTITVNFEEGAFHIEGSGISDAETFARRLQEILPSALEPAFERMAMSTGGA